MNLFDFMAANNGPQQQQDPADMLGGGGVGLSHGDAMTLSLLNAMQQQAQAGTQRTASPIGSIAQSLGPLLAAPIQAQQMEQQSMLQGLLLRAKIASLLGKDQADPADAAYKTAQTRNLNAEATLHENEAKDPLASLKLGGEDRLIAQNLQAQGIQPTAPNILKYKEDQQLRNDQRFIERSNAITQNALATRDADAQAKRLIAPADSLPENKGYTVLDLNTGKPARVSQGQLDDPSSQYAKFSTKDMQIINGAKVIAQQTARLKELIPKILPENRVWAPLSLVGQSMSSDEQTGKDTGEFDNLADITNIQGIKEFVAGRGPNQTEINNIGPIHRSVDNQARALGKVEALEGTIRRELAARGINPEAFFKQPAASLSVAPRGGAQATPSRLDEASKTIEWLRANKTPKAEAAKFLKTLYGDLSVDIQ
jgi:hypothetical protein